LVDNESSAAYQLGFRDGNASSWGWGGGVFVSSLAPGANVWHMYTYTYDSSTQTHRLYVDGANTSTNITAAQNGTPTLSSINTDRWGENFGGSIDEAHISNIARSADWVLTEYNNQSSPSTFYAVGSEGSYSNAGATWAADEDVKLVDLAKNTTRRVRFEISNESAVSSEAIEYRLQVAETDTCSTGSYVDVPTNSSGQWQIADSSYITDGEATENISPGLTDESATFVAGELRDALNTTGSITLDGNEFTEIEFAVKALDAAEDNRNYCFRLIDATASSTIDAYPVYAEVGITGASQLSQSAYRFFENEDAAAVSTALAGQDSAASLTDINQPFRLRLLMHVTDTDLSAGEFNFKLQYAAKSGECDSAFSGETYADVSGATPIAYNDNSSPTDGSAATLNPTLDPVHLTHANIGQTYEEANNFTSISDTSAGQDALWDFSLINNSVVSQQSYCLRIVFSDGTTIGGYTVMPEIITSLVFPASGTYISSAFNTGTSSVFSVIEWTWSKSRSDCSDCDVKMQLETAPDAGGVPGAWNANWCGPTTCDGTDYYTSSTGQMINTVHNGGQWVRYKATFYSGINSTPILDATKIYYDHQY
jgi:hypothetical protein